MKILLDRDGFANREIYSPIFKEYIENLEPLPKAKGFFKEV